MTARPYIPRPSRVSPLLWPLYTVRALALLASLAAGGGDHDVSGQQLGEIVRRWRRQR